MDLSKNITDKCGSTNHIILAGNHFQKDLAEFFTLKTALLSKDYYYFSGKSHIIHNLAEPCRILQNLVGSFMI